MKLSLNNGNRDGSGWERVGLLENGENRYKSVEMTELVKWIGGKGCGTSGNG